MHQRFTKARVLNRKRLCYIIRIRATIATAAAKFHEQQGEPVLPIDQLHDHVYELFTVGANALSALAALSGFLGVALESRGALLFFYINQLWSLSNVCTFFVMSMEAYEQQLTACRMLALGDMSADEAQSRELGCDGIEARHRMLLGVMGALLAQLWISCFLARTFSEMVQDMQSDDDDRQLVRFIWERRRETWQQLRRFEDVVQRQFEELRASLVSKQGLLSQLSAS